MDKEPKLIPDELHDSLAVGQHSRRPVFTDREMWVAIRGYLLGVVKAMDIYTKDSPLTMATRAALLGIAKAIELRWNLKKNKTN